MKVARDNAARNEIPIQHNSPFAGDGNCPCSTPMTNSIKNLAKRIPGAEKMAHALGLAPDSLKQRMFLLDLLPKNSIGVEIGVHLGDFSQKILQIVQSKEFHLIDPWKQETSDIYGDALYGGRAKEGQRGPS